MLVPPSSKLARLFTVAATREPELATASSPSARAAPCSRAQLSLPTHTGEYAQLGCALIDEKNKLVDVFDFEAVRKWRDFLLRDQNKCTTRCPEFIPIGPGGGLIHRRNKLIV